jgi:leucyl aminopeptidase
MEVHATTALPVDADADTIAVGLFEREGIAHDVDGAMAALVEGGEARARFRHLAVTHAAGRRLIVVGLGARGDFDPERARGAAAAAVARARDLATRRLCWELPHHVGDEVAAALVEGTALAAYRFDRYKAPAGDAPAALEALTVAAHDDVSEAVRRGETVAAAANRARDLQNTPANDMTPSAVAEAARAVADEVEGVTVEVEGREGIRARSMGCFAGVAQGSDEEPALITLRYEGPAARGPVLGLVGKAVTFDTGGISLKPGKGMHEMKFDMSGGAAVLGAVRAIAGLRLPVRLVAVVGATENMPSGRALKPGDVLRASNGVTVEVHNTDAEGRLVLADCLVHAAREGAERLVDIATLTGAIVTALGAAHCGLMASDDGWAAEVEAAGRRSGELAWRLPLHPDYDELLSSQVADVINVNEGRKAGSIVAAQFLRRFTGDLPWAHLDIAGTAYDTGRPYAPKGGAGFGVRLLVELARSVAAGAGSAPDESG